MEFLVSGFGRISRSLECFINFEIVFDEWHRKGGFGLLWDEVYACIHSGASIAHSVPDGPSSAKWLRAHESFPFSIFILIGIIWDIIQNPKRILIPRYPHRLLHDDRWPRFRYKIVIGTPHFWFPCLRAIIFKFDDTLRYPFVFERRFCYLWVIQDKIGRDLLLELGRLFLLHHIDIQAGTRNRTGAWLIQFAKHLFRLHFSRQLQHQLWFIVLIPPKATFRIIFSDWRFQRFEPILIYVCFCGLHYLIC